MLSQKVETQADNALKLHLVGDQMIGGSDHNIGVVALTLDTVAGVGDTGGCIASGGFAEHLLGLQHGQMFQREMLIGGVGHHQKVLVGDDRAETLVGASDKAFSCA